MNMLRRLVARYEAVNSSHPITVRGSIGIGLFFASDVLAQRTEHLYCQPASAGARWGWNQWDQARSVRTCTWRAVVWAPVAHYFWLVLETYVTPAVAHLGWRGVALKIAFDFVTVAPPLVLSFLCWSKFWETLDAKLAWAHASDRIGSTIVSVYCYWAPLHLMTYGIVPLRHRVAWVSLCSLGFGSLMSVSSNTELLRWPSYESRTLRQASSTSSKS